MLMAEEYNQLISFTAIGLWTRDRRSAVDTRFSHEHYQLTHYQRSQFS
jgi:hypothetical protein